MSREAVISVDVVVVVVVADVDVRERKVEDGRDLKRAKWTQTEGQEGMERDGSFCIRQEGEDSTGKWKGASVTVGQKKVPRTPLYLAPGTS